MYKLNLPYFDLKVKCTEGINYIFDDIRKKWLKLTPEEWVRQNFIKYLINDREYPSTLIAIEMALNVNKMSRRGDIIIFSKSGVPLVIVECKAPNIKINQKAFEQIAQYNIPYQVNYLIVTNGITHYCCKIDYINKTYKFIKDIPLYSDIID